VGAFYITMIGIYKITNLKNKIYIGQSINIENRFNSYLKLYKKNKSQIKLYNSLNKYGIKNHKFEIIEECEINKLNERERYWQDYYNVLENGLNCVLTKTNELKLIFSNETKNKISQSKKNNKYWLGRNHTEESKEKIRNKKKNIIISNEIKNKISLSLKNHIVTKETKNKISKNNAKYWKGKKMSEETKQKMSDSKKWINIVLDLNNGIFYNSIVDAEKTYNIKNLSRILKGKRKNKTSLILI
jgi:group I intron endonuclease